RPPPHPGILATSGARDAGLHATQELAGRAWHRGGGGLKLFSGWESFSLPGITSYAGVRRYSYRVARLIPNSRASAAFGSRASTRRRKSSIWLSLRTFFLPR